MSIITWDGNELVLLTEFAPGDGNAFLKMPRQRIFEFDEQDIEINCDHLRPKTNAKLHAILIDGKGYMVMQAYGTIFDWFSKAITGGYAPSVKTLTEALPRSLTWAIIHGTPEGNVRMTYSTIGLETSYTDDRSTPNNPKVISSSMVTTPPFVQRAGLEMYPLAKAVATLNDLTDVALEVSYKLGSGKVRERTGLTATEKKRAGKLITGHLLQALEWDEPQKGKSKEGA